MAAHLSFIVTQYLPWSAGDSGHELSCLTAGVISHWLMLVAFSWMAMEAFRILRATQNYLTATVELSNIPGDTYNGFRWKAAVACWGTF